MSVVEGCRITRLCHLAIALFSSNVSDADPTYSLSSQSADGISRRARAAIRFLATGLPELRLATYIVVTGAGAEETTAKVEQSFSSGSLPLSLGTVPYR